MNVLLGTNKITNCEAALVVNGVEVFRFRNRDHDDRLVVDFDIRDPDDDRLVKVAKNNIVYAKDGYRVTNDARESRVEGPEGKVIARVEELELDTIRITGEFWIKGHHVSIFYDRLESGGVAMSGNQISGFGTAIRLDPGTLEIGVR